jgi:autotransporter-associated beta strand protein
MGGLTNAFIKAGGAAFEPASGRNITITQALLTDPVSTGGGLTKSGAGVLTLTGTNTYTGDTVVTGGSLSLGNGATGTSLTDTADVRLLNGTTTLNLNFTSTDALTADTVDEFFIDGVRQASGTWGAVGSGAANTTARITGAGWLKVTTGSADAYASWATLKGLDGTAGKEAGKADDPDNDGKNNLAEFALDGNPLSAANEGKIVGKIATVGGVQVMTLTLPVRTGATFSANSGDQLSALIDGIYYRIEGDVSLSSFADAITEVPVGADLTAIQLGLPPLSTGWTYRTFRAPGTVPTAAKAFLRARISESP